MAKTKTKRTLATLAMLTLIGMPAWAGWQIVGSNGVSNLFADNGPIRREGDKVRMWDMIDYREPQERDGMSYRSMKVEVEYDCEAQRYRNLSATLHVGRLAEGEPVATYARPDAWQAIQAGSGIDLLAKFACDKAQKAGTRGIRRWQGLDND
jgi:hypothetical protein